MVWFRKSWRRLAACYVAPPPARLTCSLRAPRQKEVQASVTIISVQANNPLKFLPNADAALLNFTKRIPGFMRADVAMRDAFDDLRAHEVGVIAGTRAALTEVLGRFDPAVFVKNSRDSVGEFDAICTQSNLGTCLLSAICSSARGGRRFAKHFWPGFCCWPMNGKRRALRGRVIGVGGER